MIEAYQDHVEARAFKMDSRCRLCSKVNIPAWSQEWWRSLPVPPRVTYVHFVSLSIHWISFHGFMSYILLLYDTTLAWSALFSYRRVVELSVTTEDVLICCDGKMDSTGHIPLSTFQTNLIFFNLTQEVFWREFWRPGIQTPKARFLYVTPTRPLFHGNQGLRMERL